jgi:hypothetical protein
MTARTAPISVHDFRDEWTVRDVIAAAIALPLIYSLVVPLALLDLWVSIYQALGSRLLGIERVARRDYFVVDRHRLGYLNAIQKLNCAYCGYASGVIAFVREVSARTEQYWCPIKHARKPAGAHLRHRRFATYGDAAAFRRLLPVLRQELRVQRRPRQHLGNDRP